MAHVWRDVWNGSPNVVVISEYPLEEGVVDDALLFTFDEFSLPVVLLDEAGHAWTPDLPAAALAGNFMSFGLDLFLVPLEPKI